MKKRILKIDGLFLMIMGTLAAISDLVGYFAGAGPFGTVYYQNSIVIGGFEAHCLAAVAGLVLYTKSTSPDAVFFNKTAVVIHSALGISNLTWFSIFYETGTIPMGYATTIVHFLFVLLNGIATLIKSKPSVINS